MERINKIHSLNYYYMVQSIISYGKYHIHQHLYRSRVIIISDNIDALLNVATTKR